MSFFVCDDDCAPALRKWEDGRITHRVSLSDIFASVWLGCYHQAGYMVNVASGRGGVGGGERKQQYSLCYLEILSSNERAVRGFWVSTISLPNRIGGVHLSLGQQIYYYSFLVLVMLLYAHTTSQLVVCSFGCV